MAKSPARGSGESTLRAICLPDELVAAALEYLPFFSLWSAAAVSRQFYNSAWLAGLYIPTKLDFNDWTPQRLTNQAQLQRFNHVLDHVRRKDLRLSLGLTFKYQHLASGPSDDYDVVPETLLALTAALPFLVALYVTIPDEISAQVSAALRHPAPRLRSLCLAGFNLGEPSATPPPDIFAGYAPRLCELGFSCGALGQDRPIPAFSNVVRLNVRRLKNNTASRLSYHFPRVATVLYDFIPPAAIDCEGAALRRIVVRDERRLDDDVSLRPHLKLENVAEVRYQCEDAQCMSWDEPLGWRTDGGPLSVRLSTDDYDSFVDVAVVARDKSWRRTYCMATYITEPHVELNAMPDLPQALGYLRIDAQCLLSFLQIAERYPVLRCVRIDVGEDNQNLFDSSSVTGQRVQCPALETLSLFAIAPTLKGPDRERRTNLKYADVAFVLHALSPLAKPVLELDAISVTDCTYHPTRFSEEPLLSDLFAAIRELPFPGRTSGAYSENGLWEEFNLEAEGYLPVCLPRPY